MINLENSTFNDVPLYELGLTQEQCPSVYKKLVDLIAENDMQKVTIKHLKNRIEAFIRDMPPENYNSEDT